MKTINNKNVLEKIKMYLLDCMDFSGYIGYGLDTEPENDREKVLACYNIFKTEKEWEIPRIGERKAFQDWLQGLASALTVDYTYYDQGKLLENWLEISEEEADRMVESDTFWNYCARAFFEMLREAQRAQRRISF